MSSAPRAKRRSSAREIPWPPKQMWYCSVSLQWKRSLALLVDRGLGRAVAVGHAGAEVLGGERRDLLVLDVARGGDDDVLCRVAVVVVGRDPVARDARDHRRLAEHAPSERMVAVDGLAEDVVDTVLRLVLVHRDLLEHDLALGVDLVLGQRRVEQHLRHQVERVRGVLVEESRVQVRRLLRGRGVGRRAHAVEQLGDLDRRVAIGPLEQQVLEEVREALLALALVPRAGLHPEPEGDRADRGDDLRDHTEAIDLAQLDVLWKGAQGCDASAGALGHGLRGRHRRDLRGRHRRDLRGRHDHPGRHRRRAWGPGRRCRRR